MDNASLNALRDIHLPPPPGLWPPAPGWWLVALAILAAGLALRRRRASRRRPLRDALNEIDRLAQTYRIDADAVRLAGGISTVLRHYACLRFPDATIAGLTGAEWLRFLDERGGNGDFRDGPGAALASLPYRAVGIVDGDALIALARRWLEANVQ